MSPDSKYMLLALVNPTKEQTKEDEDDEALRTPPTKRIGNKPNLQPSTTSKQPRNF